jgi:hypothetical protein
MAVSLRTHARFHPREGLLLPVRGAFRDRIARESSGFAAIEKSTLDFRSDEKQSAPTAAREVPGDISAQWLYPGPGPQDCPESTSPRAIQCISSSRIHFMDGA